MANDTKLKEFDVVKYANPTETAAQHPEYGADLENMYGIVRDSFRSVVYVEFFGKNNKPLDLVPRPIDVLEKVGTMFDLIKKSQEPAKVITKVVREPRKAKVADTTEDAPKRTRKSKKTAVEAPVTETTEAAEANVADADTTNTAAEASSKLNGLRMLPTGLFDNFSRASFVDSIISNGGVYGSGGVNKKLDILIVGRAAGPAKIEKAKELGIKMITEAEYLEMIK